MDQHFARTEMLPPMAPPITERGAVKWLRENLFSTPFNIALTLAGLAAIVWLITASLPWWLNSVWTASSLTECRQIVEASAGPGATGACWAMIREWWGAFLFGFYPPDQWWRPILAFGFLFAALAPVLFSGQKRNLTIVLGAVAAFLLVTLYLAAAPGLVFAAAILAVAAFLSLVQSRCDVVCEQPSFLHAHSSTILGQAQPGPVERGSGGAGERESRGAEECASSDAHGRRWREAGERASPPYEF